MKETFQNISRLSKTGESAQAITDDILKTAKQFSLQNNFCEIFPNEKHLELFSIYLSQNYLLDNKKISISENFPKAVKLPIVGMLIRRFDGIRANKHILNPLISELDKKRKSKEEEIGEELANADNSKGSIIERFYKIACEISNTAQATALAIIKDEISEHLEEDYDLEARIQEIKNDYIKKNLERNF